MDDNSYFSQYMRSFEMIFAKDCCAFVKDAEFRYQLVTETMARMIGAESSQIMIGRTISELGEPLVICNTKIIEQWHQQDLQIQQFKRSKTYLEVLPRNGKNHIQIIYKTPIINPETNNFLGIHGQVRAFVMPHVIKTLFTMHGGKGSLMGNTNTHKNPLKEYPLTEIQHMVLFLAINNYSYSEISVWLSEFGYEISPVRVNDYLEQLKLIFHVRNKTQLIEKAIGLNLHSYLPEGLFNKESSIEISAGESATICHSNCNDVHELTKLDLTCV